MNNSLEVLSGYPNTQSVYGYYVYNSQLIKTSERGDLVIADFFTGVNEVITFDNNYPDLLDISFYYGLSDEPCYRGTFTIEELSNLKFENLNYLLTLQPFPTARKYLLYYIRMQAKLAPVKRMHYIDRLGHSNLNGQHIFCAGNTILPIGVNQENFFIAPEIKSAYRFDYDNNLTEHEAIASIFDFINIEPMKTSIIMTYSMLSIMRGAFKEAGLSTNVALMVVGDTQSRKTSAVCLSNSLFNRSEGLKTNTVRIDSSSAYFENMLSEFSDLAVNYDDIYRDPINKRRNEERARAIIREVADDSPRNTAHAKIEINAQVSLTAEYIIKSTTDIGRVILLILHNPLDSERLYKCQQHPLYIASFYRFFISWIYSNFDNIVNSIQEDLISLRARQATSISRYSRLDEYQVMLESTFSLFLEYCIEVKYFDHQAARDQLKAFREYAEHLKSVQEMVLDKISNETGLKKINYAKAISDLLKYERIKPDSNPRASSVCFIGTARNIHTPGQSRCLFIKSEYLMSIINYYFKQEHTVQHYIKYFSRKCLLSHDSSCNFVKRFGTRFLAINLDLLEVEAKSEEYKLDSLF